MSNVKVRKATQADQDEPRCSVVVNGFEVNWRLPHGWRCRCGGPPCRHVRAAARTLPAELLQRFEAADARLGRWTAPIGTAQ